MKKGRSSTLLTTIAIGILLVSTSTLIYHSIEQSSESQLRREIDSRDRRQWRKATNLWNALTLSPPEGAPVSHYSHARCIRHDIITKTGEPHEFGIPEFVGRTCRFDNLFFNPASQSFAYIISPEQTALVKNKTLFENSISTSTGFIPRTLYTKAKKRHDFVFSNPKMRFSPSVFAHDEAPMDIAKVPSMKLSDALSPVLLLYRLSFDFNFGHFVFDDALTIFSMLDIFGFTDSTSHQPVPLPFDLQDHDFFYRCNHNSRWAECVKMLKRVSPMLGVNPFGESDHYLDTSSLFQNSNSWIRIPTTIVGTGDLAYWACIGPCAAQRSPRIYKLRSWILNNMKIDPLKKAIPGRILVSLPIGNSHEGVEDFHTIIPALRLRFGNESIRVFDMANLTLHQQIMEAAQANIYLTNNGGGSASSIFLPEGSTVLLFHQPDGPKRDIDWYSSQGYLNYEFLPARAPPSRVIEKVLYALSRPP